MSKRWQTASLVVAGAVAVNLIGLAQAGRPFTTAFSKEEFAAGRLRVT